jgi:murein DD-endopeptidase MepM/ murein hydrolase activator NlpD
MRRTHYLAAAAAAALLAAPAARAAPALRLVPDRLRPGDLVLVAVEGVAAPPEAAVAGRPVRFFAVPGGFLGLAPLPIDLEPGPLEVEGRAGPDGPLLRARAEVVPPGFPETRLTVAPRFVTPSPAQRRRMEADQAAFDAAFAVPFGPPAFAAPFAPPREDEVTAPYGQRRVFNGRQQGQHHGVDVAGAVGDPVLASNDGRVVLARDCYASGRSVVVSHGVGLFTVYFHLSRMDVRAGDAVRRGQAIGRVGKTGRVTGPHLHFGVKVDGLYVDPDSVYRLDLGPDALSAPARPAPPPAPPAGAAGSTGSPRRSSPRGASGPRRRSRPPRRPPRGRAGSRAPRPRA